MGLLGMKIGVNGNLGGRNSLPLAGPRKRNACDNSEEAMEQAGAPAHGPPTQAKWPLVQAAHWKDLDRLGKAERRGN
jgi:hypothetical protein